MLKTNSAKAKERIRLYVAEEVRAQMEERKEDATGKPFADYIRIINKESKEAGNTFAAHFEKWFCGLGGHHASKDILLHGAKDSAYKTRVRELLAEWLNETPEESARYSETECERLALYLFRENLLFLAAHEK